MIYENDYWILNSLWLFVTILITYITLSGIKLIFNIETMTNDGNLMGGIFLGVMFFVILQPFLNKPYDWVRRNEFV